ncbi:MAG: NAD(P)-dependent oxidoreductase [Acidobacteriota bacterium]
MSEFFRVALTADFLLDGRLQFRNIGLDILESEARIHHRFLERHDAVLSPDDLHGLNALICLSARVTSQSLTQSESLLAICRFGVGYDTVDVDACTEADVALFIARGAVNHSVAEAALTWMLALGHHLLVKDQLVRKGKWSERSKWMGSELRHKVVGIVGLGGIGCRLVELLRPLGVTHVLAFDPYADSKRAAGLGVTMTGLPELMRESDYVVISCPLTEETRGLIGEEQLALMKPDAYLINVARGGIVKESPLVEVLEGGRIGGAAFDVYSEEPPDRNHPFFSLDNMLLAPHSIAWTHELFEEIGQMCCRQVASLSRGILPDGLINREVTDRPGFQAKLRQWRSRD